MEVPSSIELKLISCKDINAFTFFQKLTIYAIVSIESADPNRGLKEEHKQQQRTQTDRDSDSDGRNPEWNHEARFDLGWASHALREGSNDLFLRFEFRHDGVILGDKLIGECRVSLADLVRDAGSVGDVARFVSYQVRSGDGKPNGIFNFSYKLKGFGIGSGSGSGTHTSQILEGRISGYPVLAPEDCDPNQSLLHYPMPEIENSCCYPTVASAQEGLLPPPPDASAPSFGECCYYYPPPPPPTWPYPYPPPPPPPVMHGVQYYPPFGAGPQAYSWPSGPSFEHRW